MFGFALIGGVLAVWVTVVALVWHGKGDVGITPAVEQKIRLRVAIARVEQIIGDQLTPALQAMTVALKKTNDEWRRLRVHLR